MSNYAVYQLAIALLVITWIAVSLRLGVRLFMIKSCGLDDLFLIAAQAIYTAQNVLDITKGSRPIRGPADVINLLEFVLIAPLLYVVVNIFIRISLGLCFLRFLTIPWQRRYVYISVAIYTAFALSFFIVNVVFYGDVHATAEKVLRHECQGTSECNKWPTIGPMAYTLGALNTWIDLTFAVLPIFFIRKSNMPLNTKISVCGLLGLGGIAGIASIIRFPYIDDLNINSGQSPSNTFVIASTVETAVGIVALSMSALRPLFALKLNRTMFTTGNFGSHGSKGRSQNRTYNEEVGRTSQMVGMHGTTKFTGNHDVHEVNDYRLGPLTSSSPGHRAEDIEERGDTSTEQLVDDIKELKTPTDVYRFR